MSTGGAGRGPYRIVPSGQAREQWAQLPTEARAILERQLGELAWMVGLRQWVSDEEAEEDFELITAGCRVSYRLEPRVRTLRLNRLERGE